MILLRREQIGKREASYLTSEPVFFFLQLLFFPHLALSCDSKYHQKTSEERGSKRLLSGEFSACKSWKSLMQMLSRSPRLDVEGLRINLVFLAVDKHHVGHND